MKHARLNNKTYIRANNHQVQRCMVCDKVLNGRGKPNSSGICSACSDYNRKRKREREKLNMIKKEHLYTFDDADRLIELNKYKITKIRVKENDTRKKRTN